MNERDIEHLDELRIATLASGESLDPEAELHLAGCRQCAATYAELVRLRAQELAGEFKAPPGILAAGHMFVEQRVRRPAPLPRTRFAPRRLAIPGIAVVALLLVFVLRGPTPDSGPGADLPESVRQELIAQAAVDLVSVMVADAPAFEAVAERGAGSPSEYAVLDDLERHAGEDPRAKAEFIAGLQAYGLLPQAREQLEDALEDYPEDEVLAGLHIYQDYAEGRLAEAKAALQARVASAPDDHLARLNLAILLHKWGDESEKAQAIMFASGLADRLGDSGMGLRARGLVESAPH